MGFSTEPKECGLANAFREAWLRGSLMSGDLRDVPLGLGEVFLKMSARRVPPTAPCTPPPPPPHTPRMHPSLFPNGNPTVKNSPIESCFREGGGLRM